MRAPDVSSAPLSTTPRAAGLATSVPRARVSPGVWLAAIVAAGFCARLVAAFAHAAPRYFPDEYIYSALARSISEGRLSIRGSSVSFPALLEPLLAAPAWLVAEGEGAYRLTQGMHALAVSLAPIPVFWLARRLGLPPWQALCAAAFATVLPALVYASYVTADAVAYPLVLAAVAAGVAALDRPTPRAQVAFVGFAGLATFARVQYVVLPLAFLAAAAVVSRFRPRELVTRTPVVWVALGAGLVGAVALGPGRTLGYYAGLLDFSIEPLGLARWIGVDLMMLAFAAGWVLVPGALVGLWHGLVRPGDRAERAFAALAVALASALLLEAGLYATNGSARFQERYLFTVLPLVPIAFALAARRLPSGRVAMAVAALGLLLVAMRVPLTGYTAAEGKQDSPFLMGAAYLEERIGTGGGALLLALVASVLCLVAAVAAYRPRVGTAVAFATALVAGAGLTYASVAFDVDRADRMAATYGNDRGSQTWIDDRGLEGVGLLVTPGTSRPAASAHLFWNTSISRVLRLPGTDEIDSFGDTAVAPTERGALLDTAGRPVFGPLLVEEYLGTAILDDADLLERTTSASLWQPRGEVRLAALLTGRLLDGWASTGTTFTIWPAATSTRRGTATFTLGLPARERSGTVVEVRAPGYDQTVRVRPGTTVPVRVPFQAAEGPVRIVLTATEGLADGLRILVGQMSVPRLVETNP